MFSFNVDILLVKTYIIKLLSHVTIYYTYIRAMLQSIN